MLTFHYKDYFSYSLYLILLKLGMYDHSELCSDKKFDPLNTLKPSEYI